MANHLFGLSLTKCSKTYHPLGALLFVNGTYRETLKIINQVNVPAEQYIAGAEWRYDYKSGAVGQQAQSPQLVQQIQAEAARYIQQWPTAFGNQHSAPNLRVSNSL